MEKTSRAWARNKAVATLLAKPVRPIPAGDLAALQRKARQCRACGLWKHATQTVFGGGAGDARIVLIGEQPGLQEDFQGLPFVGPAGGLLDRALEEAQLERKTLYLTNTAEHFKYQLRGERRLHKPANTVEQEVCRMWLGAELARLQPRSIVALGAMAAQTLFGSSFSIMRERGPLAPSRCGYRGLRDCSSLGQHALRGTRRGLPLLLSAIGRVLERFGHANLIGMLYGRRTAAQIWA
jgi:uracil-DNA glycosylase